MDVRVFHYQPTCSAPGCGQPAIYKVAAAWSDGTSRELKNYGLACERHRDAQHERGRLNREGLALSDGETLGPVGLYALELGKRDIELVRLNDQ